jgi:hypothetical protein
VIERSLRSVGAGAVWPTTVEHGPLASVGTIYELPDGRHCTVTFANRGADALSPVRNDRGDLWVGYLLDGDAQPAHFDDWERGWVPAELLRPIGDLGLEPLIQTGPLTDRR